VSDTFFGPPARVSHREFELKTLLKTLAQRWNDWCGDRDKELAIRQYLTREGYYGGTAKLRNVRLVAIARPGWLQVYRFEVTARLVQKVADDQPDPAPIEHELFGLVRDDGRRGTDVRLFRDEEARKDLFARWSDGLICLRGTHGLRRG
jgi:hypothetical protein